MLKRSKSTSRHLTSFRFRNVLSTMCDSPYVEFRGMQFHEYAPLQVFSEYSHADSVSLRVVYTSLHKVRKGVYETKNWAFDSQVFNVRKGGRLSDQIPNDDFTGSIIPHEKFDEYIGQQNVDLSKHITLTKHVVLTSGNNFGRKEINDQLDELNCPDYGFNQYVSEGEHLAVPYDAVNDYKLTSSTFHTFRRLFRLFNESYSVFTGKLSDVFEMVTAEEGDSSVVNLQFITVKQFEDKIRITGVYAHNSEVEFTDTNMYDAVRKEVSTIRDNLWRRMPRNNRTSPDYLIPIVYLDPSIKLDAPTLEQVRSCLTDYLVDLVRIGWLTSKVSVTILNAKVEHDTRTISHGTGSKEDYFAYAAEHALALFRVKQAEEQLY